MPPVGRADGVIPEATMTTLRLLGRSWDAELALAFAAILLSFARDAGNQGVLACRECLQLLRMLLRVSTRHYQKVTRPVLAWLPAVTVLVWYQSRRREGSPATEGSEKYSPLEDCVVRVLQGGGLGKGLPEWISTSPAALALLAVAGEPPSDDADSGNQSTLCAKSGLWSQVLLTPSSHSQQVSRSRLVCATLGCWMPWQRLSRPPVILRSSQTGVHRSLIPAEADLLAGRS